MDLVASARTQPPGITRLVQALYSGQTAAVRGEVPEALLALARAEATAAGHAARGLLDRLPFGVLACDAARRLVFASDTAARVLATGACLAVRDGRLVAADDLAEAALQDAVARLEASAAGALHVRLEPCACLTPMKALVFAAWLAPGPAGRRVILLVSDAERPRALGRLLGPLYGLTRAEAALTVLRIEGLDLLEAARARRIALATARGHWQSVLCKLGGRGEGPILELLRAALVLTPP